jgi:hypothetical protein
MASEETFGVATSFVTADVLKHRSGGTVGFYGTAPIAQATVAATTTTTATTTALQTDIDAIRTALQNLGLIG